MSDHELDNDDVEYLNAMDDLNEPEIPSDEEPVNHEWDGARKKTEEEEEVEEESNKKEPRLESPYGFQLPQDEIWYRKLLLEWIECDLNESPIVE